MSLYETTYRINSCNLFLMPQIPVDRSDRRFHHPLHMSDMTRFMEYFWTLENRQKLNEAERLPGEKKDQGKGTPTVDSG